MGLKTLAFSATAAVLAARATAPPEQRASFDGARLDAVRAAQLGAIGEFDRMTLKFRKPL